MARYSSFVLIDGNGEFVVEKFNFYSLSQWWVKIEKLIELAGEFTP